MTTHQRAAPTWRKSSYSTSNGSCVEIAALGASVAVRNSNHPDAGTLYFGRAQFAAWLEACKAGDLDDLTRS